MALQEASRKGDKRQLILNAAVHVFAEKGFHQARVSDVADRAGVADGTIYLYFRNKDDLLISIFEDSMDTLLSGLQAALDGVSDPFERIRIFARFHLRQVRDNPAEAEVLQVQLRGSNKFLTDYRPEKLWAYIGVFADAIRQGQSTGQVRNDVDPFLQMWGFFGALDELGTQWVLAKGRKIKLDAAAKQVADTFIRGVAISPMSKETS